MKTNTTFRIAAILFVVLMFAKPSLADSVFNSARSVVTGTEVSNTGNEAFAADRNSGTDAVNYATPEQQESAANKKIGALGASHGADHHSEIEQGARWSACEPIRFVINTQNAPKGAVEDFKLAIKKMNGASALDLEVIGTTKAKSTPSWADSAGESDWRPVLISWATGGTSILSDHASGTATNRAVTNSEGKRVIVSGQIVFNFEHDDMYTPGFGAYGSRTLLYMHEIGHVLGLDHVDDKDQMMYKNVAATVDAGAGDLTGLKALGKGGCLNAPRP
jgi:hypothetical protein